MKVLTEAELRAKLRYGPIEKIKVDSRTILSPAAVQFAKDWGIEIQVSDAAEGSAPGITPAGEDAPFILPSGKPSRTKPEHLTHLRGRSLVPKTHPRINLRGKLDLLQGHLIEAQVLGSQQGLHSLVQDLGELLDLARQIMRADVLDQDLTEVRLLGMEPAELRAASHSKWAEVTYRDGLLAARLNLIRGYVREAELAAAEAYIEGERVRSPNLILALNRMSSAAYVLVLRLLDGHYGRAGEPGSCHAAPSEAPSRETQEFEIPAAVSNRHVHLCRADCDVLFGPGHQLEVFRELSQPGEFASKDCLTLAGPKGNLSGVRVLGPLRARTQVEVSRTDAFTLGLDPPVRDSGLLEGTPGVTVIGPKGTVRLSEGLILALRHIHLTPSDADRFGVRDKQFVRVRCPGDRALTFDRVIARVSPNYRLEMHLDTDEANSARLKNGDLVILEV